MADMIKDHDLAVERHGSICLIRPYTFEGEQWLQRTAPEGAQFMGKAMAVEPRYVQGVIDAAQADGMKVAT